LPNSITTGLARGIGELDGAAHPLPVRAHPRHHGHPAAHDLAAWPHELIPGIHAQRRSGRLGERAVPPGLHSCAEVPRQRGDEALRAARAAHRFGDRAACPGGDALAIQPHERERERLLMALRASEPLRGAGAGPVLGHRHRERADAGAERARLVAVALSSPPGPALIGLGVHGGGPRGCQERLHAPLHKRTKEIGSRGRDGWRRRWDAGTLLVGQRRPPSLRPVATTDRGGRSPPVTAAIYVQNVPGTTV
jgi:hypothetical protein